MDDTPYGLCPKCGHPGLRRERRPDGNDTCAQGHVYPSAKAVHVKSNDIYNPDPFSWTGTRNINLLDPDPEDFLWPEIARSLSLTYRYGGFSAIPVSVAQHLLLGDFILRKCRVEGLPDGLALRKAWLLHDAAEAYLGDDQRPLKKLPQMAWKSALEDLYHARMCEKWDVTNSDTVHRWVKMVDNLTLSVEVHVAHRSVLTHWASLPTPPEKAVKHAANILTETAQPGYSAGRLITLGEELGIR